MTDKMFTVNIDVYYGLNFFQQALENIRNQTYSNLEIIISNNGPKIDLSIMSLCNSGIMSASSFAWWGAYLMKKKQYIVFPKYWLGWKTKVESHPGIQPPWSNIIDVE